jgi:hypothetical protein
MSKLMDYPISISPAQMRKIVSGGAITLAPKHFVEDSASRIKVMPNTARRIATALRKNKGVRIQLKPEEDIVSMTEGGAISMKKLGKKISKGAKATAGVIKRGFDKEIVESGVGKEIAKQLIDTGANFVLPTALSAASMMAGDPTGKSGELIGNIAGSQIDKYAERKGYGVFKTARKLGLNKVGINKKSVTKVAKEVGKVAVREGAKVVGEAISAYTGNPAAGVAFERIAVAGADKAIDSGSVKKGLKASKSQVKRIAAEEVDKFIDKNLSGVEKDIAEKALAGKYPSASDLIYDYSNAKMDEMAMSPMVGYGIPRRVRGGLRMGKGLPRFSYSTYDLSAIVPKSGSGVSGFRVSDDRKVTPAEAPSDIIQTGSPYQRINSAAMSPFIPASPQLAGFRPIDLGMPMVPLMPRMGGSIYPAGRMGRGFVAAG